MFHHQVLEQLKKFQTGERDLQQLEEWVIAHLQQILDSREDRAIELANEIDALFIEEDEDLRSRDEVRNEIARLYSREISTAWTEYGVQPTRSSSEHTVRKQWGGQPVITGPRTLQVA